MAWWRKKREVERIESGSSPAMDLAALESSFSRLREVCDECGRIGKFLDEVSESEVPIDPEKLVAEIESCRVPGFIGYKLAVEAVTLLELVSIRVAVIQTEDGRHRNGGRETNLAYMKRFVDEAEPLVRATLESMSIWKSLDGKRMVEKVAEKARTRGASADPPM